MPLPSNLAKLNKMFTNRFVGPLAKVTPMLGVVHHVGRRSGREYRTPVIPSRYNGGFVVALTYGRDNDWVKNVVAAGSCKIETRGRIMDMVEPRFLPTAEGLQAMPTLLHLTLNSLHVTDFLYLREASA